MVELFRSLDTSLFTFINITISNSAFDAVMPGLTNWNQSWIGRGLTAILLILLMWKGGRKGRYVTLLIVILILITDQLSSSVIKPFFARPRPCHQVNGARLVPEARLLVDCGSGYSFPSSHAVNNFALATLLAFYYRRYTWIFVLYAFLMGFSRIVVGVHFPSDVAGGALLGCTIAALLIVAWNKIGTLYPALSLRSENNTTPLPGS